MSFKEEAIRMLPAWIIGATILGLTFKSKYRQLLRVKPKAISFMLGFISLVAVCRFISWKLFHRMTLLPVDMEAIREIPWQTGLFVYWEDATFVLPFMIFKRMIVGKKYMKLSYYAIMFLMCLDFGMGHMYQNPWAGLIMMAYIPMVMEIAEEYGVGTVMVCHTLFDLAMIGVTFLATKGS